MIYQYILVRTDIESLNPGKLGAHTAHAANRMVWWIRNHGTKAQKADLAKWEKECQGVGTCIVLAATDETMKIAVAEAQEKGFAAGVWTDPTFPSTTSRGFRLISMDVCAWFIGDKDKLKPIIGHFNLYK